MYLLDTNTIIYYFKGAGRVSEHLLTSVPAEVALSTVSLFELLVGVAKSAAAARRGEQLRTLLSAIRAIPFADAEASEAAAVRAELERAGTPIGPLDNLIAGTARAHGATLVTRNVKELGRIPNLVVENWY